MQLGNHHTIICLNLLLIEVRTGYRCLTSTERWSKGAKYMSVNQEKYASLMLSHNSEMGIPNIIKEKLLLMFIKNYCDMKLNLSVASHHIYKRSLTCLEWKGSWCGNKLLTNGEAMLMQAMMSRMDGYQAKYWFS
jgi:hypothetical protein